MPNNPLWGPSVHDMSNQHLSPGSPREGTFRINGLGKYFVTSTLNRDYPMIMATFLLIAFLWGILYLLTDIAYTMIDPRVRLGAKSLSYIYP